MFKTPLQNAGIPIFFVPAVFVDTSTFGSASVMDGELNWNGGESYQLSVLRLGIIVTESFFPVISLCSGWPTGNSGIDFSRDNTYLSALGSRSQGYMATVSPSFYTREFLFDLVPSRLLCFELTSRSLPLSKITLHGRGTRIGSSRVTSEYRSVFGAS